MKLLKLVWRNLRRRPVRTLLSVGGVASAMVLLILVESLSMGMEQAMSGTEAARTLVVFRKNRYCPQTSFLPERYTQEIEDITGVQSVLPVKVYLNNCRASLDLVAFQGTPVGKLLEARDLKLVAGDLATFEKEADAALVGKDFADRRGIAVGETFRMNKVDVKVRGIFTSSQKVEESLILTHLEYLQRAGPVNKLGTVTQYEVKIADANAGKEIAREIDELFRTAEEPTDTRPKLAYLESATRDLREILRFGRLLGLACVLVVLSLVANTVFMSVQERVREFGVLRAFGFRSGHIGFVVALEALSLAALGGALGSLGAILVLRSTRLAIGTEGVTVSFVSDPSLFLRGFLIALATGLAAGIVPALLSARRPVVEALRS